MGLTTFAILKPDLVSCPPLLSQALKIIQGSALQIKQAAYLGRICSDQLKDLYKEHDGRFYQGRLLQHVGSGPVILMELVIKETEKDAITLDPIQVWRNLIGPSKFLKGYPELDSSTVRFNFALSDVRNSAHGADSEESAKRELSIFTEHLRPVNTKEIEAWTEMMPINGDLQEEDLAVNEDK